MKHLPLPQHRPSGMTLIELMVALAIGAFLMLGAITVFMQSRTTFRVTESVSRLQENARFALEALEPDIRMAGYWGLTRRWEQVNGRATPVQAPGLGAHSCGNNWTLNLAEPVQGTNNTYTWACATFVNAGAAANSDTLVVRRVSEDPVAAAALTAGTLYIQSSRAQIPGGQVFAGTVLPGGLFNATTSATHRLMVSGYYVSPTSTIAGTPSLRRKSLQPGGGIIDEEILLGVEDLQVQFGIDTDIPSTETVPSVNRGSVDRYVNPNDPIITPTNAGFNPNAVILAVRIWLRVRGDRVENGVNDTTNYQYADRNVGVLNDGFRRVLVSKTIYLRNARPPS